MPAKKGTEFRREQQRQQAIELRKAGASYYQIGQTVGIAKSTACRYVQRALAELIAQTRELAEEARALDLARLDAILLPAYQRATSRAGDDRAARVVLDVLKQRAALLGLDAPAKHEVTGRDGEPLLSLAAVDAILGDARAAR